MKYTDIRFADIQMLRYELTDWDSLSLQQQTYIYYLTEAALAGRDITWDQFGRHNLRLRQLLEAIYTSPAVAHEGADFLALQEYLRRVWFANGIYHHYSNDKFQPAFSREYLVDAASRTGVSELLDDELLRLIFDPTFLPKKVNVEPGADLVQTSAVNFYEGVSQQEVQDFYAALTRQDDKPSWGLNSRLVKQTNGEIKEETWCVGGRYSKTIERIVLWLEHARQVAENDRQRSLITALIDYYRTGDLHRFDDYSIEWVKETEGRVDFVNGFIEVYDDPLGRKGTWEALVDYRDEMASVRTETICHHAQWFEDHSPVGAQFKKPHVTGLSAKAIHAAVLAGGEYPATAIGINLPNATWIRQQHGSKSVTISNITDAYDRASQGSGLLEEFVPDEEIRQLLQRYGKQFDDLHTDLHECLGHGSGQLLPGVSSAALGEYYSTIEEARADLFGLYYMADEKLVQLGLTPGGEAHRGYYYRYLMNALLTQLYRIEPGKQIEEAHMQNRALIARWCMEHGGVSIEKHEGRSRLIINDYALLRQLFAQLLAEVQRITSEGDYEAARQLVETYGKHVDADLHTEVRQRYERLNLPAYRGFINPRITHQTDSEGRITAFHIDYSEPYDDQMLRYSREYSEGRRESNEGKESAMYKTFTGH